MIPKAILLALACSLAVLVGVAGCSGDGTTLGPSGTPDTTMDGDNGDNGENGDNGDNGDAAVTLATLSAEIFTPSCAVSGCHAGPNASNGMSLEAGVIASEIIGVTSTGYGDIVRIAPGDPDNSLIVQKVRGEAGGQMPQSAPALSDEAIAKLIEWIEAGANP